MKSVTNFGFSVSTTHTASHPRGYGVAVLSVFKSYGNKFRYGDHHKREFDSSEAADAFKLERGYTVPYVNARYATAKKVDRAVLRELTSQFRQGLTQHRTCGDVFEAADSVAKYLRLKCGWDQFDAMKVSNSLYYSARRVRPELFPKMAW